VVNGHKSAARADSQDGGTGKTCLGRGMHCPTASSLVIGCTARPIHSEPEKNVAVYF